MGVMIHQRHEHFGLVLEADETGSTAGQDADQQLLAEVAALAAHDPAAATRLLVPACATVRRPPSVHQAYRDLLRRQNLREDLLVHGQIWIAALIAEGESRRALGVLQDCRSARPGVRSQMTRAPAANWPTWPRGWACSASPAQLCRGYLHHWPRDPQAAALRPARHALAGRGR